jgi:hypothetical protein
MTVPRCMTLEQYRQLEAEGKITRPLTGTATLGDSAASKARRANDIASSSAQTHVDPYGTADRKKQTTGTYPGCGTPHGITAHERRYERPCDACKQAKNAVNRAQWAARRDANAAETPGSATQRPVQPRNGSGGTTTPTTPEIRTENP